MPLSLNKLGKLLYEKDFIPLKFYRYDGQCIFIEIVSLASGSVSLMYIPSRFTIPIGPGENVIEVDIYDFEEDAGNYTSNPMKSPDETYGSLDISAAAGADAANFLSQKYKKSIQLSQKGSTDKAMLKDIIRQLSRLQYCVEDLPYYLAITEGAFLCYMRDSDPDCYIIQNYRGNEARKLRVVSTLELFYSKGNIMDHEISEIGKGIQRILDKNLSTHASYLENLVRKKGNMAQFSTLIERKKEEYRVLIRKYEGLLRNLDIREKNIKAEKQKFTDSSLSGGLDIDLKNSQVKGNFDRKIQNCISVKQQIIDNIIDLRDAMENIGLSADKILYDNSVMMDKIFKNFSQLISICS